MPFVRFTAAVLSAYVFMLLLPEPSTLFLRLSHCGGENWDEGCEETYEWCRGLNAALKLAGGSLWLGAWALLELSARKRPWRRRRLLTHVCCGPVAVMALSVPAVALSDAMLIQQSRWRVARYVHGDAPPLEPPEFDLHNNHRGWCGNGYSANEYRLYGESTAAHFDDPDPLVRARAVLASVAVYDWLNDPRDGPAVEVLRKAAADPDPLVRRVAAARRELLLERTP